MVPVRIPRLVRGAVAATFATFVALFAHVVAGGQTPAAVGILVPLTLSISACTLMAGRRLSLARLAASVGVSQLLFHTLFVLGAESSLRSASMSMSMSHHSDPAAAAMIPDAETSLHSHDADAGMWIGHGIAALVTVGVLYFAERMLLATTEVAARMVGWVRRLIEALTRPVPPVFAPRDVIVLTGSRAPHAGVLLGSATRRGPPLLSP